MKKLNATTTRQNWSQVIRNAERGERTIVTRRGRPSAAIISSEDYELVQRLRWKTKN